MKLKNGLSKNALKHPENGIIKINFNTEESAGVSKRYETTRHFKWESSTKVIIMINERTHNSREGSCEKIGNITTPKQIGNYPDDSITIIS